MSKKPQIEQRDGFHVEVKQTGAVVRICGAPTVAGALCRSKELFGDQLRCKWHSEIRRVLESPTEEIDGELLALWDTRTVARATPYGRDLHSLRGRH
jgi:hypothetical protein